MTGRPATLGDSPPDEVLDVAACKGMDPTIFFAERGESTTAARAVCSGCPAMSACADWAITTNQVFGIWGNTSPQERRRYRKERGLTLPPRLPRTHCGRDHPMTGDNLYANGKGHRRCVACHRDATLQANRDRKDRQRGAA